MLIIPLFEPEITSLSILLNVIADTSTVAVWDEYVL